MEKTPNDKPIENQINNQDDMLDHNSPEPSYPNPKKPDMVDDSWTYFLLHQHGGKLFIAKVIIIIAILATALTIAFFIIKK